MPILHSILQTLKRIISYSFLKESKILTPIPLKVNKRHKNHIVSSKSIDNAFDKILQYLFVI